MTYFYNKGIKLWPVTRVAEPELPFLTSARAALFDQCRSRPFMPRAVATLFAQSQSRYKNWSAPPLALVPDSKELPVQTKFYKILKLSWKQKVGAGASPVDRAGADRGKREPEPSKRVGSTSLPVTPKFDRKLGHLIVQKHKFIYIRYR